MKPGRDDLKRLLSKITKTESCWIFNGSKIRGYGQFRFEGKTQLAHRVSYKIHRGIIPKGLELCHKCDVRDCVNPDHLFIGTRSDNMKDCVKKGRSNFQKDPPNKKKTHCPQGHPYAGNNIKLENNNWRRCRICSNEMRMRNYYASR